MIKEYYRVYVIKLDNLEWTKYNLPKEESLNIPKVIKEFISVV